MSIASKILDFVEQPDVSTCQSAAIARVVGTTDVMSIRKALLGISSRRGSMSGDPAVMGDYLKENVREYQFIPDGSLNQAKEALEQGYHLITHGWFTRSGHVIGLSPFKDGEPYKVHTSTGSYAFNAEDPWYEFDFPSWSYTRRSGDDIPYSAYGIYAACVGSSGFGHAQQIYRKGELFADYDFTQEQGDMVIEFMEQNQTRLREMSLRMALKIADLTRVSESNWRALAATTCMKNS
jgi:hypothetical protein